MPKPVKKCRSRRRVVTFRPSQMLREFVEKGGRGRAETLKRASA